jgi:ABC-type polysaccharide/polyol phosphate export permease
MFATPAIYMRPTAGEGEAVALLRALNPMNSLIETFRAGVLGGPVPWGRLGVAAAIAVVVFLAGCLYFRRVEERFADIV